jgi:hypothetical protein
MIHLVPVLVLSTCSLYTGLPETASLLDDQVDASLEREDLTLG